MVAHPHVRALTSFLKRGCEHFWTGDNLASMPRTPVKAFEPRDAFFFGAAFELAALTIAREDNRRMAEVAASNFQLLMLPLGTPGIVNSAFALELYFKCLIWTESGGAPQPIREHKLLPLFQKISAARQKRISDLFDQVTTGHPWWIKIRTKFPSELPNYRIPKVLENGSNAFKEHRYTFEGIQTAKECFFSPAVPATRETILEMQPDWRKLAEQLPDIRPTSPVR